MWFNTSIQEQMEFKLMRILQRTVPTRMLNIACNAYHLVVINYWSSEVVQPEYFLGFPEGSGSCAYQSTKVLSFW